MSFLKKLSTFLVIFSFAASCANTPTPIELLSSQEGNLKTRGGYESYLVLEYLAFARNLECIVSG